MVPFHPFYPTFVLMEWDCAALEQHDTSWKEEDAEVTLNVTLDAAFVPSESQGTRLDFAHLVVLDNFISDEHRQDLLDFLTGHGWEGAAPPEFCWERATCDGADLPATWGLTDSALRSLAESKLAAKLEVQSRLCKLFPDVTIAHMPSDRMQPWRAQGPAVNGNSFQEQEAALPARNPAPQERRSSDSGIHADGSQHHHTSSPCCQARGQVHSCDQSTPLGPGQAAPSALEQEDDPRRSEPSVAGALPGQPKVDANPYVANAAVPSDQFQWHVDADPSDLQDSAWTARHGRYFNREPGKPLLFSLLLYLDASWPREHDAETLFLDTPTDTGVLVRPKPRRAVLMDQDVLHRLSTPSQRAGRPRYSLVFKLVMLPRRPGQECCIARPEWGRPAAFGSAAKAEALVSQMARKRKVEALLQKQQGS